MRDRVLERYVDDLTALLGPRTARQLEAPLAAHATHLAAVAIERRLDEAHTVYLECARCQTSETVTVTPHG